jgi:acetyl-CoA synthetase
MNHVIWRPSDPERTGSNIHRFMQRLGFRDYETLHAWSATEPASFWREVVDELHIQFRERSEVTLDVSYGVEQPKWFPGSKLNIVESCLTDAMDRPAILWGTCDGGIESQTRGELLSIVRRVATSLGAAGLAPGKRLAIIMPMIPESVAIYLGVIYAGCAVISIADSFAPPEIERRLHIAKADGVFCVGSYLRSGKPIDLYSRLCEAHAPKTIVISPPHDGALRPGDVVWRDFLGDSELFESFIGDPETIINILFSSGTTGDPKAIPWMHTTPIKCAADGLFHQDIRPGDVVVWPTNLGWMMGPWLIFASLIHRATIGLFEDVTQAAEFGSFVEKARVTMLGVVPTLVRHWRSTRCMESCDWSAIRCFSSTGEASTPAEMKYLSALAGGKPVIEYCGGTEIGGGYITSSPLHPNVAGAFSCPALGNRFVLLDDNGRESNDGELYLVPPALGLSMTLLNRDHHATYYEGCPPGPAGEVLRRHGDHFRRTTDGFYVAGGRVDDTMNLGGIKVSSAEIEAVLNAVEGVAESAAVTIPDPTQGPSQLAVFVVTEGPIRTQSAGTGSAYSPRAVNELRDRLNVALRQQLNPLFKISEVRIIDRMPRTASNKIMRRELRTSLQREVS